MRNAVFAKLQSILLLFIIDVVIVFLKLVTVELILDKDILSNIQTFLRILYSYLTLYFGDKKDSSKFAKNK